MTKFYGRDEGAVGVSDWARATTPDPNANAGHEWLTTHCPEYRMGRADALTIIGQRPAPSTRPLVDTNTRRCGPAAK